MLIYISILLNVMSCHVILEETLISLPKIRRQRVFQAFSVPGAEQLQKLLSVGPEGKIFRKTNRNLTTTPKGKNFGKTSEVRFSRG